MSTLLKLILVASILVNIIAIWGLLHYVMYGGSPLGQLKRRLTGTVEQPPLRVPLSEQNAKIRKEIEQGITDSLRVVFLGASITREWDLKKYFPEIHPINRGIGGYVNELLIGFKSHVIDLKPKVVVIKLCSINIRPQIPVSRLKNGMEMMVQLAKANDIIPIVATIIPSAKAEAHIGDFSVVKALHNFNDWVRDFASENSIALIDFEKSIQDENGFLPRDCSIDPVHLNDKGYDIVAKPAQLVIYKTLGLN